MEDCSNLYQFFENKLGRDFTEPPGAPSLSRFRLVEMYTSCTDADVKDKIITSFTKPSVLRVICATVAFGMGPNVRVVGPPEDIESYIQETGCAGRDGLPSQAILLLKKTAFLDDNMKAYCKSTTDCRRHLLFSKMEGYDPVLS